MSSVSLLSLLTTTVLSQRPVNWESINCPGGSADSSCTYRNTYQNDVAVSIFFQTESQDGGSYFSCVDSSNRAPASLKKYYNKSISVGNCPQDYTYSTKDGWQYCLITGISFPPNPEEYCDYLTQGYEGFTYKTSDDPNYKCPSTMRQSANNDGITFCTEDISSSYKFPNGVQPYCNTAAFNAGELGFRWGGQPTSMPTPAPKGNATVYCERGWNENQQGSAGDCYFILPKGNSFTCNGQGTTNIIGAHAVQLNGTIFSGKTGNVNCPNNANSASSCQYTNNNNVDELVGFSFSSNTNDFNQLSCYYLTNNKARVNLCNFTSYEEKGSGSSCNFIIPSGKTMTCLNNNVKIKVASITSHLLTDNFLGDSEPMTSTALCPSATYPNSTMCDCTFTNPYNDRDVLVVVDATNLDNQFASFHCGVWGTNICAFGVDDNNEDNSDSCWFILPAGAEYDCQMQWGSSAFTSSTVLPLKGTIYDKYNPNLLGREGKKELKGSKIKQSRENKELRVLFNKWKEFYGKSYPNRYIENYRFNKFKTFISLYDLNFYNNIGQPKLTEHNIHKINSFADLSRKEFEKYYHATGFELINIEDRISHKYRDVEIAKLNIPTGYNWVDQGAVTPIKNQGQCGSCWSFGTTGVLESHFKIAGNELQSLSEQNLVSCDIDTYNDACNGGFPYKAIEYVSKNGIDTEVSYPYVSGNGNVPACEAQNHQQARITGHVVTYKFLEQNEAIIQNYIATTGPVQANVDAMTQLWWPYTGGIMTGCCNVDIDHAVMIVGYNQTSNGDKYWIVKNSWGTSWGENGYLWLQYGTNQCGIDTQAMVPVLK